MKKLLFLLFISSTLIGFKTKNETSWIRINQLGYLPNSIKIAVFASKESNIIQSFSIYNSETNELIYSSKKVIAKGVFGPFTKSFRLDFSDFNIEGSYYIKAGETKSPIFRINADIYDGTADFLLKYMRQQRCGFNPYLVDSCHTNDGYIVYHPKKSGQRLDVTGGWHDATDYLQYTATSANAVFQLLFAYRENAEAFEDTHQANGMPGPNAIPDIIDEAKFGMDWLIKMNPSPVEFYNQIADDRDHKGYRLPNHDQVIYDPDKIGRPVYLATGKAQGLIKYKNRSTGVASTAGKFSSAFAIGADVLKEFYPGYATQLIEKAIQAYSFGKQNPGVSQTAPGGAPYFYEEDNWYDDMELAASELNKFTNNESYKNDALNYAALEKVSPWMGLDSVKHYQYYPFLNAGHHELAKALPNSEKNKVAAYYAEGLELLLNRGKENPFLIGIPFVWCSNNFVTAALSQAKLYHNLTGDTKYLEMEASLRDWLFGCNPWGTSMIVGLPSIGDNPQFPHSSFNHLYNYQTDGGLVDGPVYSSIFNSLIGLVLEKEDSYAEFQSDVFVYHDDVGDYSTNEPTMDGTASLVFYLSSMEKESAKTGHLKNLNIYDKSGAIIRGSKKDKKINLIFTGHEYAEGSDQILQILKNQNSTASFFLTGDFYRNPEFKDFIEKAHEVGHYLGAHSDKHLLYNDWSENKKLLVSENEFKQDLLNNYDEMEKFGIEKSDAPYFLPPYEWNDATITQWANQLKITLINFTPGTFSPADYTTPDMGNYKTTEEIVQSVLQLETAKGMEGFLLLSHLGSDTKRTDKFFNSLENLIITLKERGYEFVSIDEVLQLEK